MKRIYLLLLLSANFAFSQLDITGTTREDISYELYDDFKYIQELDPTFVFKKTISVIKNIKDVTFFKGDVFKQDSFDVWIMVYSSNSIEYRISTTLKDGKIENTYGFFKKVGNNKILTVTYSKEDKTLLKYYLNKDKVYTADNF